MRFFRTIIVRSGLPVQVPADAEYVDFEYGPSQIDIKIITREVVAPTIGRSFIVYRFENDLSIPDGYRFLMMKDGVALFMR